MTNQEREVSPCGFQTIEALSEEGLKKLAHLARDASYEQGEVLPEPQEGGEKRYVLKEGRVQLYVMLPSEGEITLSVVEAGSIFGEIAVAAQGSGRYRPERWCPLWCAPSRRRSSSSLSKETLRWP